MARGLQHHQAAQFAGLQAARASEHRASPRRSAIRCREAARYSPLNRQSKLTADTKREGRSPAGKKSVWVRQSSDRSIYMMGAVNSPGRYAFREGLSFLDILSAANGLKTSADLKNIRVSHRTQRGSRISKLGLALYFETGDDKLLLIVAPGNVI